MSEESFLRYPLADTLPAPGTALEIAPGIRWLRMPLPFALNHINLWLLRDQDEEGREGWAIVDCGISDDDTRAAWTQVFTNELQGLPVLRVIVTHMHPDHIGLAHWLTEQWNCRLWISATDWNTARLGSLSVTGVGGESAAAFFASHGLIDPESLGKIQARHFPKVFGLAGNEALDDGVVRTRFDELAERVGRPAEVLAEGFIDIAVQQMAGAIKKISVARGYDVTRYTLQCFG